METLKAMTAKLGKPRLEGNEAVGGREAPALPLPAASNHSAAAMSDPILANAEKCLAAWDAFRASGERQPVPLYCTEHDEWERQHNEVAGAWRDALCDLLATVPTTRQG
jgi:hypothetical protein